jgi:hypothetical protein
MENSGVRDACMQVHLPFHLPILTHQHPYQQRAIKPLQNRFQSQLTGQVQQQDFYF